MSKPFTWKDYDGDNEAHVQLQSFLTDDLQGSKRWTEDIISALEAQSTDDADDKPFSREGNEWKLLSNPNDDAVAFTHLYFDKAFNFPRGELVKLLKQSIGKQ